MEKAVKKYFTIGVGEVNVYKLQQMAVHLKRSMHYIEIEQLIEKIDKVLKGRQCNVPQHRERGKSNSSMIQREG